MKKLYFKKLLSLFLAGTVLAGVGCKDYDDDIKDLNKKYEDLVTGRIAPMEQQMAAMKTTIDNLTAADVALGQRIDALKTQGDANAAAITALENAQKQLRTELDAIKANYVTKDFLTTTLGSYATTASVANAVAAVKTALGAYTTEKAINDAIEAARQSAIKAAGEACAAAFQAKFDAAVSAAGLVNADALEDAIDEYDAEIREHIASAIEDNNAIINEKIAKDIADAKTALTTELKKWISARMTSLTLIPESYVSGIEAIDFSTLQYVAKDVKSSATAESVADLLGAPTWYISEKATPVRYHVSPSVVTNADVKAPAFLFEQVKISNTSRAAVNKMLVNIEANDWSTEVGKAWNIANSEMTVNARRVASAKTFAAEAGATKAITAALKVPIADNLLQDGEAGTVVYSDYAKLQENFFDVRIAALRDDANAITDFSDVEGEHYHFYAKYDEGAANITAKPNAVCNFDGTIDLLTLVTGCARDAGVDENVREITKADLAKAGLKFRFAVPAKPFKRGDNTADNQQYIKLSGDNNEIATPVTPEGTVGNQACIDKTPVVRVELIDTKHNDAVVDACYIQLKWAQISQSFDLPMQEYTLGCNYVYTVTWKDVSKYILEKMNGGKGMSQADFVKIYCKDEALNRQITTTDKYPEHNAEVGMGADSDINPETDPDYEFYASMDANAPESAAAFMWQLTSEQIGTLINPDGTVKAEYKDGKKMHITIIVKRTDDTEGTVKINFSVNIKVPALPCTVNYLDGWWHSDYTYIEITPQKIETLNPGMSSPINNLVDYRYNLHQIFNNAKPLSGMNACSIWDIQFAKTQPVEGYAPALTGGNEPAGIDDVTGYTLKKGSTTAIELGYNASMGDNWYGAAAGKSEAIDCEVDLSDNAEGKALVGKKVTAKLWGSINPQNTYLVKTFDMKIVAPLKISNTFTNSFNWNLPQTKINCGNAIKITDWMGAAVATTPAAANLLYEYYDVKAAEWQTAEAKVNIGADGKLVSATDITAENFAEKTATFKSVDEEYRMLADGSACFSWANATDNPTFSYKVPDSHSQAEVVTVMIPLTVKHRWGEFTVLVKILVKPATVVTNVR